MVTPSQFYFGYGLVFDEPTYARLLNRMRTLYPKVYDAIFLECQQDGTEDWERDGFVKERFEEDVVKLFQTVADLDGDLSGPKCFIDGNTYILMLKTKFRRETFDGYPGRSHLLQITPDILHEWEEQDDVKEYVHIAKEKLGLESNDFGWIVYECC